MNVIKPLIKDTLKIDTSESQPFSNYNKDLMEK